jgi:hypothetical protein
VRLLTRTGKRPPDPGRRSGRAPGREDLLGHDAADLGDGVGRQVGAARDSLFGSERDRLLECLAARDDVWSA